MHYAAEKGTIVRDSTGAGDAFVGALASGLRRGLQEQEIFSLASYVAAANCAADGARGGMPLWRTLPGKLKFVVGNGVAWPGPDL